MYEPVSHGLPVQGCQDHGWGGVEEAVPVPWGRAHLLHSVRVRLGSRERKGQLKPVKLQAGSLPFFSNNHI